MLLLAQAALLSTSAGGRATGLTRRPGSGQVAREMGPLVQPSFVVSLDPETPPPALRRAVYAIGNFDGVHRGHQAVLAQARAHARATGAPSAALTFEPHPADHFAGRPVVFRLTPFDEKCAALADCGIAGVVSLTFDGGLASLSAEAFVVEVLKRRLGLSAAVVGADFHFGKGRGGSPRFLQEAGAAHGFDVVVADKVEAGGEIISSSAIRKALEIGDVAAAARLLGRPYRVAGEVVGGQRLGRTLGVPTANLKLPATNRLAFGVYAVRASLGARAFDAVASFGVRPTVDGGAPLLETYIFDFDEDIYGRRLGVDFVGRIRPELKFGDLDQLKAAMQADMSAARAILRVASQSV
jgi:riboflavin kinase/FMN adenylyltransferase